MLLDRGVYTGCKIISSRYMLMTSSSFIYSFTTNKDKFTYYHVGVTSKYKYLFNHNFKVALDKAKIDMERWSSLRLSLAGKINSVTSTFIWKIKKTIPWIRKEFLERRREAWLYQIICTIIGRLIHIGCCLGSQS